MRINTLSTLIALTCALESSAFTMQLLPSFKTTTSTRTQLYAEDEVSPLVTAANAAPGGEAPSLTSLPAASGPTFKQNDEEGQEYDGTGGLGLAKGTVNTYVLPGMDEMTGEEYRKALQASVIERQMRRSRSGIVGNRQSQNYLDNLENPK